MSASRPESFILSLFDTVDALTEYCMADNEQKEVIAKELLAELQDEEKSIPGMVCDIKRQK